jgi:hypothetical protein
MGVTNLSVGLDSGRLELCRPLRSALDAGNSFDEQVLNSRRPMIGEGAIDTGARPLQILSSMKNSCLRYFCS